MYFETSTLGWILFTSLVYLAMSFLIGDIDSDVGHGHMGFAGDTDHGVTTSELFNFRNLALLAAGFSATSIIAKNAHYGEIVVNVVGICGALAMVTIGVWLFRVIRRQESNSITSNASLVGKVAVVTTSIPEQGFGEITLRNALGVSASLTARSKSTVIAGSEVKIIAVAGNIVTVTTMAK